VSEVTPDQLDEIERINACIASEWPDKWAKANAGPKAGKKRNQLRKWWRYHEDMQKLRAQNPTARCATCSSFTPFPNDSRGRMICQVESDYYGYQIASPDGLCLKWSQHND